MTAPLPSSLDPTKSSAYAIIQAQLQAWGIPELATDAYNLTLQGYGTDAITVQLENTDAYRKRFAGNEARVKAGLPALTPGDYISAENSYAQVLKQYGLPAGFYDSKDDFTNFIANDVSPSEVDARAKAAQQVWLSSDTGTQQAWKSYYGLTDGAAIASILDPEKSLPMVQRMATSAQIGGAALNNGLTAPTADRAAYLADQGVTQANAQKGYGQIAATYSDVHAAASRFGTTFTQTDAENSQLLGEGSAVRKQTDIANAEKALFGGRASADNNTQNQRTSGSY